MTLPDGAAALVEVVPAAAGEADLPGVPDADALVVVLLDDVVVVDAPLAAVDDVPLVAGAFEPPPQAASRLASAPAPTTPIPDTRTRRRFIFIASIGGPDCPDVLESDSCAMLSSFDNDERLSDPLRNRNHCV